MSISNDYVFYNSNLKNCMTHKLSPKIIETRHIYEVVIHFHGKQFPIHCILDLGRTSYELSHEPTKPYRVPVVKSNLLTGVSNIQEQKILMKLLITIPLEVSFWVHTAVHIKDHAFDLMNTSKGYNTLIPARYLENHLAEWISTAELHFPDSGNEYFGHDELHPAYSIEQDVLVGLRPDKIDIGAIVKNDPFVAERLPAYYLMRLHLFHPKEANNFPCYKRCDHLNNLEDLEDQQWLWPIYQLWKEEEKVGREYLREMIQKKKIWPSSSPISSLVLILSKGNWECLGLGVDHWHLNKNTIQYMMLLPTLEKL